MSLGEETTRLQEALVEVGQRVSRYRPERIGEQNTKAALIVPLLRILGWDVENLDEVQLEYRRAPSDRPVDYALLLQREPVLFIEAKALGENLNDRRWASQVISYAAVAGVEWVVLTDGDEYRIYNALSAHDVEDKLFRSVRVSVESDAAADALRLLTKSELRNKSLATLWRAQSIDNRVRRSVEALFGPEPSPWLVRRLARTTEGVTSGDVKAALARARISLDFPAAASAPMTTGGGGKESQAPPTSYNVTLKQLLDAGLIRSGSELRKTYLGERVTATVEPDGRVRFGGDVFNSLSVAAAHARVSVKGPPPDGRRYYQTNGWTFWEYEDETGEWQELQLLRQRYLGSR